MSQNAVAAPWTRLGHLPISFFSVILGMTGFTIAWARAESLFAMPTLASGVLLSFTIILFATLSLLYPGKMAWHWESVAKELDYPVKLNFFPTFSISLILLSITLLHGSPAISRYLWIVGAVIQLALTLYVISIWIGHTKFEIVHINPAWFILVVGNILVPIVGVEHFSPEISWFYFSIGVLFWLVLLTIVFYRVIFHHPLSEKLVPTFFILIAPPAVGFLSYVKLVGGIDSLARVLCYSALFLFMLLLFQYRMFTRPRFFLSWRAYSFPLAVMAIATLHMYERTSYMFFQYLSVALLTFLTGVILVLTWNTLVAVVRREICVEDWIRNLTTACRRPVPWVLPFF